MSFTLYTSIPIQFGLPLQGTLPEASRPHSLSAGPGVFRSAMVSLVAYFRHQTISATALSLAWLRKCIIWLLRRLRQEPDQYCVFISSKLKPSLLETPKMQKDEGRVCRRLRVTRLDQPSRRLNPKDWRAATFGGAAYNLQFLSHVLFSSGPVADAAGCQ